MRGATLPVGSATTRFPPHPTEIESKGRVERLIIRVPERGRWETLNGTRQAHRSIDQDVPL